MKKKVASKPGNEKPDELRPEYDFDYSKARPNRFASEMTDSATVVVLDPDVSEVFTTPESVNQVLRALISNMPKIQKRRTR